MEKNLLLGKEVCGNCGRIHPVNEGAVFSLLGVEMCNDCCGDIVLPEPECGFACGSCVYTCYCAK